MRILTEYPEALLPQLYAPAPAHVNSSDVSCDYLAHAYGNAADHTFVVIQPDEDDPAWFASVAVLDDGGYEIVRRDTTRREHDVTVETSIDRIAGDLTKWLAARAS